MPTPTDRQERDAEGSAEQRIKILEMELELARLQAGQSPGAAMTKAGRGKGGQFRLLAGQHVGDDGTVYNKGQLVPAAGDLVLKFGGEKFLRVSDRLPTARTFLPERNVPTAQTSFPHGQVSKGHPEVVGGSDEVENLPANAQGPASPETYAKEEARVAANANKAKGKDDGQHTGEQSRTQRAQERERESVLKTAASDPELKGKVPAGTKGYSDGDTEGDEGDEGGGGGEDLHGMTVQELRELAEGEEIDLKGAARKDDIIKKIEEARGA